MTQTELYAAVEAGAGRGEVFEEILSNLRIGGATIPAMAEGTLRGIFDNAGGKASVIDPMVSTNSMANSYGENNFASPGEKNAGLQTVTPNSVIGDNKLLSLKGLIGDGSSTGVLKPAFNAYMAYKKTSLLGEQLEETKRMNLAKEQAMKDANMMLGIEKDNVVRQANRYANIGAYGANSQGALMRNMVTTQYRNPNPYNRVG